MKKGNNAQKGKDSASKIHTPTPPQVMDPSKRPAKQTSSKSDAEDDDKKLTPREEL